jgi:hypothetical protein
MFLWFVLAMALFLIGAFSVHARDNYFYIGGGAGVTLHDTNTSNLTGTAKLDEQDFGLRFLSDINCLIGLV